MALGEGCSFNKAPLFDGASYSFWKIRMQTYLSALGFNIWVCVRKGYKGKEDPTNVVEKKLFKNDSKARNALMCGLLDSELSKS